LLDSAEEIWVLAGALLDEVNLALEQILQPKQQPKIGIGMLRRRQRLKLNQEIEVAPTRLKFAGRSLSEERQAANLKTPAERFELLAMGGNGWVHMGNRSSVVLKE
jgi:hypothetical protein